MKYDLRFVRAGGGTRRVARGEAEDDAVAEAYREMVEDESIIRTVIVAENGRTSVMGRPFLAAAPGRKEGDE